MTDRYQLSEGVFVYASAETAETDEPSDRAHQMRPPVTTAETAPPVATFTLAVLTADERGTSTRRLADMKRTFIIGALLALAGWLRFCRQVSDTVLGHQRLDRASWCDCHDRRWNHRCAQYLRQYSDYHRGPRFPVQLRRDPSRNTRPRLASHLPAEH